MQIQSRLLKPKAASEYIGMSHSWLAKSRINGPTQSGATAPPFIKIGTTVLYDIRDLDVWIDSHYRLERI